MKGKLLNFNILNVLKIENDLENSLKNQLYNLFLRCFIFMFLKEKYFFKLKGW